MTKMFRNLFLVLAFFALNLYGAYPSKTIQLVVPSKAGGSTDTTARLFADVAKKYWKDADFMVVNKPGAGGLIGFEAIARSKPDGYTWGLVFTPQLVAHIVAKRAKYTMKDFKVVGNIAEDPGIVVVHPSSPIKNLSDLVKLAKKKKLTVAVNGIGSDDFLAAKNFEKLSGVEFNLMPTKGSTEQKAAILGNHIDASFMNLSQMLSQHKAKKARIIAILSKKRSEFAPDVSTAIEQNFDVLMTATRGYVVDSKVKDDIYKKIEDLYKKVVNDPDFIKKCSNTYIFLDPMDGKTYADYLDKLQGTTQKVYDVSPW
ncbi:MAG: hypothetical protein CR967_03890 [Proteobacteria bacterium]|nr:MAG: hypothetical protein CR967_03890 [Pseudomonadota bacterium]